MMPPSSWCSTASPSPRANRRCLVGLEAIDGTNGSTARGDPAVPTSRDPAHGHAPCLATVNPSVHRDLRTMYGRVQQGAAAQSAFWMVEHRLDPLFQLVCPDLKFPGGLATQEDRGQDLIRAPVFSHAHENATVK